MRRRLFSGVMGPSAWGAAGMLALGLLGCGDDSTRIVQPGVNAGPNPAGSCTIEATELCREYSEVDVAAGTEAACASAGGLWQSTQCAIEERKGGCLCLDEDGGPHGLCAQDPAMSRAYAYSFDASDDLRTQCSEDGFVELMRRPPPETDMMEMEPEPEEDAGI